MPFNIGPGELIIILVIALLIVGPGRLPDVGAALGNSIREFRRAASDVHQAAGLQPLPASVAPPASAAPPASRPAPAPAMPAQADTSATDLPHEPAAPA